MSYKDLEKRRETQRKWRERNREKLRSYYNEVYGAEYKRQWRENKPGQREADREARKEYYYAHQSEEQRKAREFMREYYHREIEKCQERNRRQYQKKKEWFKKLIDALACQVCGEADSSCLDFHHRNPEEKEKCITQMLTYSEERILQEISKCDVLCANCHRKEHARLKTLTIR